MTDRLRAMEVFVAVVDAGSFAKAARTLGLSAPAATRAVAALEDRLGTTLLRRTTRSLSLTEPGERYLERARRLLAEVETAEAEAAGGGAVPHGHLTMTASVTFARRVVAPLMCGFLRAYPQVGGRMIVSDRVVNLVEEGIDVAVRIGPLADSSLIARRIGAARRMLVASPDYLDRAGTPEHPRELTDHAVLGFVGPGFEHDWRFVEGGQPLTVRVAPRFEINDAEAAIGAAERGEGVALGFSYLVADALAAGRVVPVLEAFASPLVPVHIVYPPSRLPSAKVRAFVDYMAPRLAQALVLLAPPAPGALSGGVVEDDAESHALA